MNWHVERRVLADTVSNRNGQELWKLCKQKFLTQFTVAIFFTSLYSYNSRAAGTFRRLCWCLQPGVVRMSFFMTIRGDDAYLYLNTCPNIVMVDTRIIVQSPARFLRPNWLPPWLRLAAFLRRTVMLPWLHSSPQLRLLWSLAIRCSWLALVLLRSENVAPELAAIPAPKSLWRYLHLRLLRSRQVRHLRKKSSNYRSRAWVKSQAARVVPERIPNSVCAPALFCTSISVLLFLIATSLFACSIKSNFWMEKLQLYRDKRGC